MRRPLGPIGHCSAKLRRAIEIDEEEALLGTVRIRRRPKGPDEPKAKGAGRRFVLEPHFAIPGPFSTRPVAPDGRVSFHFSRDIVSKAPDGGSILSSASGVRRLSSAAPADHDSYIARPGALMAISPEAFDGYAVRSAAVERAGDGTQAIFTNISPDAAARAHYWSKVHEHERTSRPDTLEFRSVRLSPAAWRQIAAMGGLPLEFRDAANRMAKRDAPPQKKGAPDFEIRMGRTEAGRLLSVIRSSEAGIGGSRPFDCGRDVAAAPSTG